MNKKEKERDGHDYNILDFNQFGITAAILTTYIIYMREDRVQS